MIVGPSYNLNNRKADVQRSVNLMPVMQEVSGQKSIAYLDSTAGLRQFSAPITTSYLKKEDDGLIVLELGGFVKLEP
jgi:hypothetical protein